LLKMAGAKIHVIPKTVSRYLTKQLHSSYSANARLMDTINMSEAQKNMNTVFAPNFGTRPIRLTPPLRPVSLDGLTGGASCSRSGNVHTGLTGVA
jgi:hypothetical protein